MKNPMDYNSDANSVTRISAATRLEGKLVAEGDVRVDGNVDGVLCSGGRVVAGESARLSGSLYCDDLDLWGKMDGDIFVKNVLSLKSSAVVNGHLCVNKLQVEIGARINGSCKMVTEQEYQSLYTKATAAPAATVAAPAASHAASASKPAASASAAAPAASKPASAPATKPASAPATKPATASAAKPAA